MKGQSTVRIDRHGARMIIAPNGNGVFIIELDDHYNSTWVTLTRRKLERVNEAITYALKATE